MQSNVFREKSMERVSSPEQLNDYIKVSNPAVWMIIFSIIILLIGICVWGVLGRLNTVIKTAGVCHNGVACCYVKEADVSKINDDSIVSVNGEDYSVASISKTPVKAGGNIDPYILHLGNIGDNDWVYSVFFNAPLNSDKYEMNVVVDRVSPMSFILN